jgi:hypothetical protein
VRLESARLSLTDPKEARRYQAKADAEAMRVLQAIHEVAAELFQKNTKKADAMLTLRLSLARSLAQDNLYTAAALIVDQAKIALDLLRSDGLGGRNRCHACHSEAGHQAGNRLTAGNCEHLLDLLIETSRSVPRRERPQITCPRHGCDVDARVNYR